MSEKSKKEKKKDKKKDKKEGKKKKETGLPKKPLSAFMFFSQDQRALLKEEKPDAKFIEVGKIIGERWKNLSEDDKKPYLEQSQRAKENYTKEKQKLDMGKAKDKDSSRPKRPTSSFMYFSKKMRDTIKSEFPDSKGGQVSKLLGEKWKRLSKEEKKEYEELAKQDKSRYETEVEDLKQKGLYVPQKRKKKDKSNSSSDSSDSSSSSSGSSSESSSSESEDEPNKKKQKKDSHNHASSDSDSD